MQCLNIRMMRHIQKTTQSVWTDVTTTLVWSRLLGSSLFQNTKQASYSKNITDQNWVQLQLAGSQKPTKTELSWTFKADSPQLENKPRAAFANPSAGRSFDKKKIESVFLKNVPGLRTHLLRFASSFSFYRTQVSLVRSMGPSLSHSLRNLLQT